METVSIFEGEASKKYADETGKESRNFMKFVDMHCDTLYELLQKKKRGEQYSLYQNDGHIDLCKLKNGNALLQNFAMFVQKEKCDDPKEEVLKMAEIFYEEMEKNKEIIVPVTTYNEIIENEKNGKMSALLTIEEGAACKGSLENLQEFYDLGVRMMTLTWNFPNEIGHPNLPKVSKEEAQDPNFIFDYRTPDTFHGLTEFGIEVVEQMERMGMIIDVSHLSDAGFYDVVNHTQKPFVASHSNARAISPWVRNLTDEMIHALAERGGITGLNFCADFLTEVPKGQHNPGTLEAVVCHAKHIINIGGIECLALGTDFDGIETNEALPNYSFMPKLEEAFLSDGFKPSECDKIFKENVLRIYREIL